MVVFSIITLLAQIEIGRSFGLKAVVYLLFRGIRVNSFSSRDSSISEHTASHQNTLNITVSKKKHFFFELRSFESDDSLKHNST